MTTVYIYSQDPHSKLTNLQNPPSAVYCQCLARTSHVLSAPQWHVAVIWDSAISYTLAGSFQRYLLWEKAHTRAA